MEKNNKIIIELCTDCEKQSLITKNDYKICLYCGRQNNKKIEKNNYNYENNWWIEVIKNQFINKNLPFLTNQIIEDLKIGISKQYFNENKNKVGEFQTSITIPCYNKDKKIINLLFFRFSTKNVINENLKYMPNTELTLLGLDKINNEKLYIVNTIKDYLVLYSVGITSVLYFPYHFDFSKNSEEFYKIKDDLKDVKNFVFVEDNSKKLEAFSDEFSRRVGKEKCSKIKWEAVFENDIVNAYNVYMKYNEEILKYQIKNEQPYPVLGIHELYDVDDQMEMYWNEGIPLGLSLGYTSLDPYFRVTEGRLTIVTGIPGHGKTTLLNSLLIKLSEKHGWVNAVYSPESQPLSRYFADIIQIRTGKIYANKDNFFKSRNITSKDQKLLNNKFFTEAEKEANKEWVNKYFKLILPDEDTSNKNDWSLDGLLELARQTIYRYGVKCLVIDPWNEIEHDRRHGQSETEYISESLTKIKRFARKYCIHVFIVAHPTKLNTEYGTNLYSIPKPYDISGGANWRNKADQCICVYRFVGEMDEQIVDVYIQKIRCKEDGRVGRVSFYADQETAFIIDNVDQIKRTNYIIDRFSGKETSIKSVNEFLISNRRKDISSDEKNIKEVDISKLI